MSNSESFEEPSPRKEEVAAALEAQAAAAAAAEKNEQPNKALRKAQAAIQVSVAGVKPADTGTWPGHNGGCDDYEI